MPLTKFQFKPGIVREVTSYTNEGGWYECDKVRFRYGFPEKIGGWQQLSSTQFQGTCRALKTFVALDNSRLTGMGTHLKYYIQEGGSYYDITPLRTTSVAGEITLSAVSGSAVLTVTHDTHGALANDFVTFSGAVSLGGNITAEVINQEYQIVSIIDDTKYTVEARDLSGNPVLANASDTGNGGALTIGAYQINVGLDTSVVGNGWGAGTWGRGVWGSGASIESLGDILRLWSHDNFGEDLLINVREGDIYYWDKSAKYATFGRAEKLSDLSSDPTTPTVAKQVMVSDIDRHVLVFGCDSQSNIGVQDPLLIRFSSQENPFEWASLPTNTAGDLRVGSGSEIVCAVETRQQILVFTDSSLHAMQYLGPPFTFGIQLISENTTILSPNATKAIDDRVFWMGKDDFYVYTGQVQKLPCSVRSYVFNDFNDNQAEKTFAALNSAFNEVWWFYPSSDSNEVNRYVAYNYEENLWFIGNMARTAWLDRGINAKPIATSTDHRTYYHEIGADDGETDSALSSYIQSSQVDIGDGEQFSFVRRVIPDVSFSGSTFNLPALDMIIQTQNFPGREYNDVSVDTQVVRTATVPVEQYTDQMHVRLRGRSVSMRLESSTEGTKWRLGSPRLDIRPDGRR